MSKRDPIGKTKSKPDPDQRNAVPLEKDGWPATGLLRPDQIYGVGRLPISKSQFWVLVRERELTPVRLSPKVTCFWVHELREKLLGTPTTTQLKDT